jgi:glycerol-3-phosphate acyltransferase PlsY
VIYNIIVLNGGVIMLLFQTWSNVLITICVIIASYLIGAIPFGLIFGIVFKKTDIRLHGSHNIGSTNSIRVLGKKLGFTIFFFEVLKGAIAIILVKYVFEGRIMDHTISYIFYGLPAAIGHLFPIYLKFKGGKVVATSLGIVLALTPISAISCLIVFGIVLAITGYVSICSCSAAITVGISTIILFIFGYTGDNGWLQYLIGKPELATLITYLILICIIFIKHIPNFKRLKNGTENCFKKKKESEA